MPKRIGHLYEKMLDKDFIRKTVVRACSQRHGRRDVSKVVQNMDKVVDELYEILLHDDEYKPSHYKEKVLYDQSSQKYRTIRMAPFHPDCLIQWLLVEVMRVPVFMRGLDYWSCSSIPGRGGQRIYRGLTHYIRHHPRSAKYAVQMDIHHYYDNIDITKLMTVLRRRIKDERFLRFVEITTRSSSADGNIGIGIGYNLNQWLANYFIVDIDRLIRADGSAGFYCRHMDNMTIIGSNKRKLRRLVRKVEAALKAMGLELKGDWQLFPLSERDIVSVGFRYKADGSTMFRKRSWRKFRRQILRIARKQRTGKFIPPRQARGFLSRFGIFRKYTPSRKVFRMVSRIDISDLRRIAAS